MEKESKLSQMVINLKVNIKMGVQTVKGNISGLMEALIRVSSNMVIDKV
jgi:hypothetical protein